jgi:hypothetical protein
VVTIENNPLGLPDVISRSSALGLAKALRRLFEYSFGESRTLEDDLAASARFFDPVAQGQRLRRELELLDESPVQVEELPSDWILVLPRSRAILTPEGVVAMHVLQDATAATDDSSIFLRAATVEGCFRLLVQYRAWNRHRIEGVVALLEGRDKPLQHPAIGTLLTLLVNDNVGQRNALTRAGDNERERRRIIDEAFFGAVRAFTQVLSPTSRIKSGGDRLISGWYLGEISRRLGAGIRVTQPSAEEAGVVYLHEDAVQPALALVARDLARGNRIRPDLPVLALAYDALVDAFLERRGALASYGELHESPRLTARRREQLLAAYGAVLGESRD